MKLLAGMAAGVYDAARSWPVWLAIVCRGNDNVCFHDSENYGGGLAVFLASSLFTSGVQHRNSMCCECQWRPLVAVMPA
jgi:hypothetical protein